MPGRIDSLRSGMAGPNKASDAPNRSCRRGSATPTGMYTMPSLGHFVGLAYLVGGTFFAYNSAPHGGPETHWGYALTGITCLVVAARFLGMPPGRDAPTGKTAGPDALD